MHPVSGKFTLARRFAAMYLLLLARDIDVVRSMLGGWLNLLLVSGAPRDGAGAARMRPE